VRFVVVRDNDGGDCRSLKGKLVSLCDQGGRPEPSCASLAKSSRPGIW